MTGSTPPTDENLDSLVGRIVDEFVADCQSGEPPDVECYAQRHPAIADVLRDILPALLVLRTGPPSCSADSQSNPPKRKVLRTMGTEFVSGVGEDDADKVSSSPSTETGIPDVASPPDPRFSGQEAWSSGNSPPQYELLGQLGRGGMGIVYKARHKELNRFVALKLIRSLELGGEQARERFRREALAVAQLTHPNIVQIYDVGEHEGIPYFTLELVEQGSLSDRLRNEPLPPRQAAQHTATLAQAMQAAHDQNLIHRDLKPSNVLLAEDGTLKITDFGLVKQLGEESTQTQTGAILGSPSYMAPEQATGNADDVGPRTDVYALGAILYEMLTARPPFQGVHVLETLEQVREKQPVPPRELQPNCPKDLETICLKALQKEPEKRYASAATLAADLQAFLEDRPIQARPVGPLQRCVKWARRRPLVAGLLGLSSLSLLALILALGVGYFLVNKANNETIRERDKVFRANIELTRALTTATKAKENEERSKNRALDDAYVANIRVAKTELLANNVAVAHRILHEKCPKNRRHWEWRYLERQSRAWIGEYDVGGGPSQRIELSPDGRRLLSIHTTFQDRAHKLHVVLWDVSTGNVLTKWTIPGGVIRNPAQIAIRSDFQEIAANLLVPRLGKVIKVWKLDTGEELLSMPTELGSVLAYSTDNRAFIVVRLEPERGTHVTYWDIATRKAIRTWFHPDCHPLMTFSPDRKQYASVDRTRRVVYLFDAQSGEEVQRFTTGSLNERVPKTGECFLDTLAISPDGRWLVNVFHHRIASNRKVSAVVWNVETAKPVLFVPGDSPVSSMAFHPTDSDRLAIGTADAGVVVWDLREKRLIQRYRGHSSHIRGLSWNEERCTLASLDIHGQVKLWDTTKDPSSLVVATRGKLTKKLSPNGEYVVETDVLRTPAGTPKRIVRIWNVRNGEPICDFEEPGLVAEPVFSRDSRSLLCVHREKTRTRVVVRELVTARQLGKELFLPHQVGPVFCSENLRIVATTANAQVDRLKRRPTQNLIVFDRETAQQLFSQSITTPLSSRSNSTQMGLRNPNAMAISADGRLVAAFVGEKTIAVWDVKQGKRLQQYRVESSPFTYSLRFSPSGKRLLLVSRSPQPFFIRIFDTTTGKCMLDLPQYFLRAYAFLAEERQFVLSVSRDDKHWIEVWDLQTGKPLKKLTGNTGPITCFAVSPDEKRLASGGTDGFLRLWNLRTGDNLLNLEAHARYFISLAFTDDAHGIVTIGDREMKYWDGSPFP